MPDSDPAVTCTYFSTARISEARGDLLVRHIDLLRDATRACRNRLPFRITAAVILPQVAHMIWVLPPGDHGVTERWRQIKATFTRHAASGPGPVWQRGVWVHAIRDEGDLLRHLHIINAAPVQAGLVRRAGDWPYGTRTTGRVPSIPSPVAVPMSMPSFPTAASRNC